MFSRREVAEERKQSARKKQAYRQIGIVSTGSNNKRTLNFLEPKHLGIGQDGQNKLFKNVLFSLEDGTTMFTRISDTMALKMQKKLRIVDSIISILTLANLAVWTIENETFYFNGYTLNSKVNIIRGIYIAITVPIVILTYYRSKIYIERQKHRGELRTNLSFYEWDTISGVIFEIMYNAICPLPGVDTIVHLGQQDANTDYSLDDLLYLVSFFKLYWLHRVFHHFSIYGNDKATRVCQYYRKQADFGFAIRAHITHQPFIFESLLMVLIILFFSTPLRIFERILQHDLEDFINDMWIMTLVSSTVGYGEMTPLTNFGRLTTAIAAYIGVCLFSLLIVSLSNFLALDANETQAFHYMERGQKVKNYRIAASNFIKKFLKYTVYCANPEKTSKKKTNGFYNKPFVDLALYKKQFQAARALLKDSEEGSNQLLDNIRASIDVDLSLVKKRVGKLNLEKYRQCWMINDQAATTFQKTQQSLGMTEQFVKQLEDLVLATHLEKSESNGNSEASIKEGLNQIKQECLKQELITKQEITNTLNTVLQGIRPEVRLLKARKNNSAQDTRDSANATPLTSIYRRQQSAKVEFL